MDLFTRDELRIVMEERDALSVSIYLPTYRAGRDIRENPIHLKNLLGEAEEQLVTQGLRAPEARAWLEPARALVEDQRFWQNQSDGLAVFISKDFFRFYRLPLGFDDLAIVAPRFYIRPLLPLMTGDGTFYILTLSQNQIRFMQGSRSKVVEIALEGTDIPESMAEALQYDEPLKQLQWHTQTQGMRGERPAIFHGQGASQDDENDNLRRFFQKVDQGVQALLQDEQAPLVLVGVEYLFPIYREANGYPYLIDEGVTGNVEHLRPEEIHGKAWAVVQPQFEQARQDAVTQYQNRLQSDMVSNDIYTILPAAFYGRIDTLFVAMDHHAWGNFDPDSDQITLREEAQIGDEDLVDTAAVQTLLNGGAVFTVGVENAPDGAPIAALFRYPLPEEAQRASGS